MSLQIIKIKEKWQDILQRNERNKGINAPWKQKWKKKENTMKRIPSLSISLIIITLIIMFLAEKDFTINVLYGMFMQGIWHW